MPRILYIDTTELHDRHLLASGDWEELLDRARRGQVVLAVPEVVLQEAKRQYMAKIDKALADRADNSRRLLALGFEQAETDDKEHRHRLESTYRSTVDSKIVESGGSVLPLPSASHQDVLDRVVARRKPFNENGKGYQDTLIWLSILEDLQRLMSAEGGVVPTLATGNTKDFCDRSGELDGALQAEVAAITPGVELTRVPSIRTVIEELRVQFAVEDRSHRRSLLVAADEDLARTDDFEDRASELEQAISESIAAEAQNLVGETVTAWDEEDRGGGLFIGEAMPEGLSEATVEFVEIEEISLDYQPHDEYEGDTLALSATVDAELTLDGFVEKADWYTIDESTFDVRDGDWNDHVMWVGAQCTVRLTFSVIAIGTQVESATFEGASPV